MFHRTDRISGIIRKIAALYVLGIPPDVATVVNVTRVTVSPDLRYADIFVTAVSGVEKAVTALNRNKAEMRRNLGHELSSLHTIPAVRFHVDKKSEELNHLDQLLKGIQKKIEKK